MASTPWEQMQRRRRRQHRSSQIQAYLRACVTWDRSLRRSRFMTAYIEGILAHNSRRRRVLRLGPDRMPRWVRRRVARGEDYSQALTAYLLRHKRRFDSVIFERKPSRPASSVCPRSISGTAKRAQENAVQSEKG